MEQLRERTERDALIENLLQFDVAARDGVANDDQIGTRLQILGIEGLCHRNAEFMQEIGHRWIGGGIGPAYTEAALLQHSGERRHGRAANADQVNVFSLGHSSRQSIHHKADDDSRAEIMG